MHNLRFLTHKYLQVCPNDDPGLTCFVARSNLFSGVCYEKNRITLGFLDILKTLV